MAEQELDRAASDTITERAVEALANARLSSQIPESNGDEPASTTLIRVLTQLVESTSHVLRWGDHVSIEENPALQQYMRNKLEAAPMLCIAFGPTAQSREPKDLSARSHAIDVMRSLDFVPDAAIVTRYASQIVDLLCVEGKLEEYEKYSIFWGNGERWLYYVLDVLPPQILAQHAEAIVALVKRGYNYLYQADKVLFGILLFRNMPPSIIAEHASTFLDVMEDDSQYGENSCNLEAAMEVLKAIDPTMLGVSCLARLRLMFANTEIDDDQIWELIEKIEPASIAERVDLVVTCLSVGRYERVRKWGITSPAPPDTRRRRPASKPSPSSQITRSPTEVSFDIYRRPTSTTRSPASAPRASAPAATPSTAAPDPCCWSISTAIRPKGSIQYFRVIPNWNWMFPKGSRREHA
jgi:hypothetical protein